MGQDESIPGELLSRLTRFGRVVLLDTVASTNDHALSLASGHEPAVVVARRQTRGRGRFRRPWYSDDESLTFSLLLSKDAPGLPRAGLIVHVAGLALCNAIERATGLKPLIRWPNDVMHRDVKLAGILCEGRRSAIAIGVGLNVNQTTFPEDVHDAGSLRTATGREWDRFELLEGFLKEMLGLLAEAGKGETAGLLSALKERSAVLGRRVEVATLLRRHVGTVIDLDSEGRIVLRTDAGRLLVLGAGQVRRLR